MRIIAPQNVASKYIRQCIVKQVIEREDIIPKKLQQIEDSETAEKIVFANYYELNVSNLGNGDNKVKVKK